MFSAGTRSSRGGTLRNLFSFVIVSTSSSHLDGVGLYSMLLSVSKSRLPGAGLNPIVTRIAGSQGWKIDIINII